jgi:outer membrane protein OmpA-like peptidoglycan-associated protein
MDLSREHKRKIFYLTQRVERRKYMHRNSTILPLALLSFAASFVAAQSQLNAPASGLITKSTTAIGFPVGGGSTKVDLKGTERMPQADGEAKIEAKQGITNIEVTIKGLTFPSALGAEYLTYVLWVVTPEGRTGNTGELLLGKNGEAKLSATTLAQTFSMIVTAEPYFAVRLPSETVVMETETRKNQKGKFFPVNEYKLLKRSEYARPGNPLALTPDLQHAPLEIYEARTAMDIAKSHGAAKYASEILAKAHASLDAAENSLAAKADKKQIVSTARQTVQFAEDARILTAQRQEEERIAAERDAAAAKAKEEAEAKADEEARRQAELTAAKQAQMQAEANVVKAKEEAAQADAVRARQATADLRAQLLDQLNRILDTRDTPRGLVVSMGDVLFALGKYDLQPEAREKLAKQSGVVLSHPGLDLAVGGYTDNIAGEELNQKLSEKRAESVRTYLVAQGLTDSSVTSQGFGMTMPVADNAKADGRQKNRRVEIVVSGEAIGAKVGK